MTERIWKNEEAIGRSYLPSLQRWGAEEVVPRLAHLQAEGAVVRAASGVLGYGRQEVPQVTLWLDPRQGSGDLLTLISPQPRLMMLDSGDVMLTVNGPSGAVLAGIEIKKIGDALACKTDGRLKTQLLKMQEDYEWRFLLIEGEIDSDVHGYLRQKMRKQRAGKWSEFWADAITGNSRKEMYADFISWLFSMCFGSGTVLLRTRGRDETAALVSAFHRWGQKEWEDHKSLQVFDTSGLPALVTPSIPAHVAHVLAGGVGWDKAMRVADHFKTVDAMVRAGTAEWLEIPGIGEEIVKRVMAGITVPHAYRERRKLNSASTAQGKRASRDVSASPSHRSAKKRNQTPRKIRR